MDTVQRRFSKLRHAAGRMHLVMLCEDNYVCQQSMERDQVGTVCFCESRKCVKKI
jgi:hypothetical protein